MFTTLQAYIDTLEISNISIERKELLNPLRDYIASKAALSQEIHLNFICTHNSRRSHLGQVWAQVMSAYFNTPDVLTYSGGTEETAVFPKIVETLKNQHLKVELVDETENPVYAVAYSENDAIYLFSKKYDDSSNPESDFAAIMTCSQADEDCPLITGAEKRFAITYEDPKVSDGTDQQDQTYLERSVQIATEMKYIFSNTNS
jgi:arsenate reductase